MVWCILKIIFQPPFFRSMVYVTIKSMEKLSPEQIIEREKREKEILQENINFLNNTAAELGLEITPADPTRDEKDRLHHPDILSEAEERQLNYTQRAQKNVFYLQGTNEAGQVVKAVVVALPRERDSFTADIFGPSGHFSNHDFSRTELRNNLKLALEKR